MARSDLILPQTGPKRPPTSSRGRTTTARPTGTGGSFASLVAASRGQSGGSGRTTSPGVRSEQTKVNNQVSQINRSSAPGAFKSLTQQIASGEREHAKDSGILGAVGNFVSAIPVVGQGMHLASNALQSQPVQGLLKTVDIPRAAIVSGLQEGGEALGIVPENNKDFRQQFNNRMSYRELIGDVPGLPSWAEAIAGFAGDIAFDPTSYVGVGMAKNAAEHGLIAAGRKELAEQIAIKAGSAGLKDAEMAGAERLIAEAGQRGRGALTERGLRRAGVDPALAKQLGVKPEFGIHVSVPGYEKTIGGRRVVEAVEDLKGVIKKSGANTSVGRLMRQIRNPDFDSVLTDILYSGKGDIKTRANAARVLAATSMGRGEGATLVDRMSRWTRSELRPLLKGNVNWGDAIHEVETGAVKSEAARKLDEFFSTLADAAEAAGMPFDRREGYIPHRMTLQAKEFVTNPETAKFMKVDLGKMTERFERPRTVSVGDTFLGEKVSDTSIRALNGISNRQLGFDFFETNPDKLIAKSLAEAGDAAERNARNRALSAMGAPVEQIERVVKEVPEIDPATAGRLKKLSSLESQARRKEAESYRLATRKRQNGIVAATRALRTRGKQLTNELSKAEATIDRNVQELADLAVKRDMAQEALDSAKVASERAIAVHGTATRQMREVAARRVEQLKAVVADRESRLADLTAKHQQLTVDVAEAEQIFTQAVLKHMDEARLEAAAAQRRVGQTALRNQGVKRAAPEGAKFNELVAAEAKAKGSMEAAGKSAERARAAVEQNAEMGRAVPTPSKLPEVKTVAKIRGDLEKMGAKERAIQLESASASDLIPHLRARAEDLEHAAGLAEKSVTEARKPRWKLKTTQERAVAVELADRARLVSEILDREGIDKSAETLAKWEAQALAHEMDAVRFGDEAAMRADTIAALKNDKTRRVVSMKIKEGFKDIGGGYQTSDPILQRQLSAVQSIFDSPKATAALVKGWDAWNKWFRTWAVTSPGFIVRNVEGGWLNNLVAGVKMEDYKLFRQHFKVYQSGSGWEDRFIQRYGIDELNKFRGALDAIAGTGWGQSAQEAGIGLFSKSGPRRAWDKSLGTENPLSIAVRNKNESAEELMRGAHAYMVFRRSGKLADGAWPVQDAINSVTKYHFNYRDISSFDRAAKRVIPFWTFMSRNVPLQLDILAKHPDVLNRTYGNLQRTLSAGHQDQGIEPHYFKDLGAINVGDIPGIGRPGDSDYQILDLPFLRVQEDLTKFSDIEKLFSDMNPAIKTPLELNAKKQFFSDIPLSETRMETPVAGAELPGVKQILEGIGWMKKDAEGRDVMSDAHNYAFGSLNPMANRVERISQTQELHPGDPGYEREKQYNSDKRKEALLSILFGVGVRTNAPERQKGELLRRSRELAGLLDTAKSKGYVKG